MSAQLILEILSLTLFTALVVFIILTKNNRNVTNNNSNISNVNTPPQRNRSNTPLDNDLAYGYNDRYNTEYDRRDEEIVEYFDYDEY